MVFGDISLWGCTDHLMLPRGTLIAAAHQNEQCRPTADWPASSLDHLVVPKITLITSGTASQSTIVNSLLIVTMLDSYSLYF